MARLLGDKVMPEAVQSRRRTLRSKLRNARRPIKQTRQDLVPGPDILGRLENSVMNVRDRFITRDSVVGRIKERQGDATGGQGSSDQAQDKPTNQSKPNLV